MINLYTIVVTYNGMSWIDSCLKSVLNSGLDSKIIVVDNNSDDGTADHIKKTYPKCMVLPQKTNLGFGQANNIGIKTALANDADYVFLLNQDAYLNTETLDKLLVAFERHKDFGIISPVHLDSKSSGLDYWFSEFIKENPKLEEAILNKTDESKLYELPFVNAAAWLMSRKLLETVGGFDPIFFHYREDNNYCQRALYHKFKIGVLTGCYIRHDRENRTKKVVQLFSERYFQNFDKNLKMKYANINLPYKIDFKKIEKNKYLKKSVKALIKLNFNGFRGYFRQYRSIDTSFKSIIRSRNTNVNKYRNYLD